MAWGAHAFTLTGVVWAALATISLFEGQIRHMWLWLGIALLVDAVDGSIARAVRVSEYAPGPAGLRLIDVLLLQCVAEDSRPLLHGIPCRLECRSRDYVDFPNWRGFQPRCHGYFGCADGRADRLRSSIQGRAFARNQYCGGTGVGCCDGGARCLRPCAADYPHRDLVGCWNLDSRGERNPFHPRDSSRIA